MARKAAKKPIVSLLASLAGCTGAIGDGPPPPPEVAPMDVPASPEVVPSNGRCFTSDAGEELVSVSPEGHAWLVAPRKGEASLRVLDPFAPESELRDTLALEALTQLQAWSAEDAAVLADGALWRLEGLARVQIAAPSGFASPAELCGDPGSNGFLLAGGKLFERRGDAWWVFDPGLIGDAAPRSFARFDGECQSGENLMWLTSADGTLWRAEPARLSGIVRFATLRDAAATDSMLAILEVDRLWIGPDNWQPWTFAGPTPAQLSASAGRLWMASGQQLLRFDGERFVEVVHLLEEPIVRLAAHAGGVWLSGASTICHQATEPMVRIAGLRPYARSTELEHPFSVLPSEASMSVTATLDGEALALSLDAATGWLAGRARLDDVGWHSLHIEVEAGGKRGGRSLPVKRLPEVERSWVADIAPIYQQHCAASTCHHPGGSATEPPDLGSYPGWLSFANEIRNRVVEARTMPPPSSQKTDWREEHVEVIAQWIEGGMLP